jgi:hypothetical protein
MMFDHTPNDPQPFPEPSWQTGNNANLDVPEVDSETAALFRAVLRPLIVQSISWSNLLDTLDTKGYGLTFRDGRLFLTSQSSGRRVCSLRFLGLPLVDLVARLGRPIVRVQPGKRADGEILRTPPAKLTA